MSVISIVSSALCCCIPLWRSLKHFRGRYESLVRPDGTQAWHSNDMGSVIVGFLDEPSLFELGVSSIELNRLVRDEIARRMHEEGSLWDGRGYSGRMIRCKNIRDLDDWIKQLGQSDETAMLRLDDPKSVIRHSVLFIRGVPKHCHPGYTGRFITLSERRIGKHAFCNVFEPSSKIKWFCFGSYDKPSQWLIRIDENLHHHSPLFSEFRVKQMIGSDMIVQHSFDDDLLILRKFDPLQGIGEIIKSVSYPRCQKCNVFESLESGMPELICAEKRTDDRGRLMLRVQAVTFDSHCRTLIEIDLWDYGPFQMDLLSLTISRDARWMVVRNCGPSVSLIIDLKQRKVKQTLFFPGRNVLKCEMGPNKYCLIRTLSNQLRTEQYFWDIHTGEIVGREMVDTKARQWLTDDLFLLDESRVVSVNQPGRAVGLLGGGISLGGSTVIVQGDHIRFGYFEQSEQE